MPGHHAVAPQLQSAAEKPVEFQIPVAVDAGVGSAAAFVAADKFPDDLPLEIVLEVEHVVGNSQTSGHTAGVLHVVQTTAGMSFFQTDHIIVVQPHGRTDALVTARSISSAATELSTPPDMPISAFLPSMKSLPMTFFEYISGKGECQRRKPDRQEKRMTFSAVKSGAFSGFMTKRYTIREEKRRGSFLVKQTVTKM